MHCLMGATTLKTLATKSRLRRIDKSISALWKRLNALELKAGYIREDLQHLYNEREEIKPTKGTPRVNNPPDQLKAVA